MPFLQATHGTKRKYEGAVYDSVMALAELAHGGQVIMDEATHEGIKPLLVQLRSRVAPGPDLAALQDQCRHAAIGA